MSQDSERDLFARSLGGDWQSRVHLYKKFIHENTRIRRLGARYPDVDDFLHDCFTNVLRAGHTFDEKSRLGNWVESVAVRTALERERLRAIDSSVARNFVRLCAAIEGEEPADRVRPVTYVPPRPGPEDSLSSRIAALVGEPQNTLLRIRAMENATWDYVAATTRKSVNTIGPTLVRAVDRLSRFFGAPPPLNYDLESVFFDVVAKDAAARHTDPLRPTGRVTSMQLDPAFYTVTPEARRIGLTVPSEVRTIALWNVARASAPPGEAMRGHLANCSYCSEVLRSLLLMQQALLSGANAEFLFCPGASTLMMDPEGAEEPFHRHLAECAVCRDERSWALDGGERGAARADGTAPAGGSAKLVRRVAWAAAAAVILGGIFLAGIHYFTPKPENRAASVPAQTVTETPQIEFNSKYLDLAQKVPFDGHRLMASVLPRNQLLLMEALKDLNGGKLADARLISQQLANIYNDPGAQMLFAVSLYQGGSMIEGYREMQKAEAMSPRNSFRCWSTLQCALMAGDRTIAEREVGHLSSDAEFGARAKDILVRLRARK
jgi:DNA-directed RNA polymerase specialized sigma24 family protein